MEPDQLYRKESFIMRLLQSIIIFIVTLVALYDVVAASYLFSGSLSAMESSHKHSQVPKGWLSTKRFIPSDHTITLTFALRLRNMNLLEDMLNEEISNPDSSNYRNYLTRDQINEMTMPDEEESHRLRYWIANELNGEIIKESAGFIVTEVSIGDARRALDTHFESFKHKDTGKEVIRTLGPYHMPAELVDVVQFVGGTTRFPNAKLSSHSKPNHQFFNHVEQLKSGKIGASSNSPVISRMYAGDQSLAFLILPVCQDGSTSTNSQSICSGSFTGVTVASTNTAAIQTTFTASNGLVCASCNAFPNSLAQGSCDRSNTALNLTASTVYCLSPEISSPLLQNYVPLNLTFTTGYTGGQSSTPFSLTTYLGQFLTPQFIQQLYDMPALEGSYPPNAPVSPNTVAVAEFLEQYYAPADLEQFFNMVGLDPRIADRVNVIGPNNITNPGGEASLDIQWLLGLAPGYNTTFWSLAGLVDGQEPFLEWITDVLNSPQVVYTHSVSYGDDEGSLSLDFMLRINDEFIKAGSVGITIVFSSGDVGCNSNSEPLGNSFPAFPASSPYVLAVGATQLSTKTTPVCSVKAVGILSIPCNTVGEISSSIATGSRITSGGGFSNVFGRPSYQDNFTVDYINTHLQSLPAGFYNTSGRSYPDVSALGHNFLVILAGEIIPVDGTSAAAPTMASVIAIINDRLIQKGQSTLGFVNPTLYKLSASNPEIFQDIVMGDNSCSEVLCNQYGFPAVPGYDASTGMGRPIFSALDRAIRHDDN
ncbi:hypothetical protein DFA_09883 [Cavenderia fasciculata]|uniref:Peptidase S53 domain-containing protein n=1 Tax=Cavenderia fasciculata TaxID=261658 RepID=F4Q8P1_CACFS|nr:uncharacterized protein DFA_09883 [Cavenderia fasciculata]EGG15060.1 hypothetical protein DFA_09883 [Cavenderia fasciculata]|eukprot:XP_004351780.1 hypothetical protein DFA_09883 [Cavenderia fasciculata]